MNRRGFLGATSVPLLAGCSELSEEDTTGNNTEETSGQTQIEGDAEITISNAEWRVEGSSIGFFVSNDGTTPSGPVSVTVRWYDGTGYYLGSDSVSIHSLLDGRSWHTEIESTTAFEPQAYDIIANYDVGRTTGRDGFEIVDYEVKKEDSSIVGYVENMREDVATVRVTAVLYDSGWVSHTGSVSDDGIPPGETWKFRLLLAPRDVEGTNFGETTDVYLS